MQKQIQAILQLSDSDYEACKKDSGSVLLTEEQVDRFSHLVNIHASLSVAFSNPQNIYGIISMSNRNRPFSGMSPLDFIEDGSVRSLEAAARAITICSAVSNS